MKPIQPETITPACPRYPVKKLIGLLPKKFIEQLEQNQQIASCCRHPENHEVEAFKSKPDEKMPDIYIFHCPCGKQHRRFCIGGDHPNGTLDIRPCWEVV